MSKKNKPDALPIWSPFKIYYQRIRTLIMWIRAFILFVGRKLHQALLQNWQRRDRNTTCNWYYARPLRTIILLLMLGIGLPQISQAQLPNSKTQKTHYPKGNGKLRLYHTHLKELTEIIFRENGKLQAPGLAKANHALRSRTDQEEIAITPELLDLMDHLQDHFEADTVEIISGYRSGAFNRQLKDQGRDVADNSHHVAGQAIDFHLDEIREETIRDYLLKLKLGGVGFYGNLDFIHIDTGPFRTWKDRELKKKSHKRKLIGVLKKNAAVKLTSNRNEYLPGQSAEFTWNFPSFFSLSKIKELKLQKFWRGQWRDCSQESKKENSNTIQNFSLPISDLSCTNSPNASPYGKYRWVFKLYHKGQLHSSNEFYFKRM